VIQPWIMPGRHALLQFRHLWPPLRMLIVCSMLTVAAWPSIAGFNTFLVAVGCAAIYLTLQFLSQWIEYHPRFKSPGWQYIINIVRHLSGIAGLTLLIWHIPG